MPSEKWRMEELSAQHDGSDFDCGKPSLNDFLKKYAIQNQRLGISKSFVASPPQGNTVCGYYCLSAGAVLFQNIEEDKRRGLPRYPIPVCLIGRLAVDKRVQKRGLGETLLLDALERIVRAADYVGIHAVKVDAKDEEARSFYAGYGFTSLLDSPLSLYLPIRTIKKLNLI